MEPQIQSKNADIDAEQQLCKCTKCVVMCRFSHHICFERNLLEKKPRSSRQKSASIFCDLVPHVIWFVAESCVPFSSVPNPKNNECPIRNTVVYSVSSRIIFQFLHWFLVPIDVVVNRHEMMKSSGRRSSAFSIKICVPWENTSTRTRVVSTSQPARDNVNHSILFVQNFADGWYFSILPRTTPNPQRRKLWLTTTWKHCHATKNVSSKEFDPSRSCNLKIYVVLLTTNKYLRDGKQLHYTNVLLKLFWDVSNLATSFQMREIVSESVYDTWELDAPFSLESFATSFIILNESPILPGLWHELELVTVGDRLRVIETRFRNSRV